jgi:hypothetical protein
LPYNDSINLFDSKAAKITRKKNIRIKLRKNTRLQEKKERIINITY